MSNDIDITLTLRDALWEHIKTLQSTKGSTSHACPVCKRQYNDLPIPRGHSGNIGCLCGAGLDVSADGTITVRRHR